MDDDNNIRLVLDLLGVENVDRAVSKLRELRGAMTETYELEGNLGSGFEVVTQQIDVGMDHLRMNAMKFKQDQDKALQSTMVTFGELTAAAEKFRQGNEAALQATMVSFGQLEQAAERFKTSELRNFADIILGRGRVAQAAMDQVQYEKSAAEQVDTILASSGRRQVQYLRDAGAASPAAARGVLDLGRAFQDLAQGGVGGVLNNLEGISRAMENMKSLKPADLLGGAGLAGLVTAVGTAAYIAWPKIKEFFEGIDGHLSKPDFASGRLESLKGQIDKTQKEFDDLTAKGNLSPLENLKAADLNKVLRDLKTSYENTKTAGSVGSDQDEESRKNAAAVKSIIAEMGGSEKFAQMAGAGKMNDLDRRIFDEVMAGAIRGRVPDIGRLSGYVPDFEPQWQTKNPESVDRWKRFDMDEGQAGKADYEARVKADKEADALNAQGRDNEVAMRRQHEEEVKKDQEKRRQNLLHDQKVEQQGIEQAEAEKDRAGREQARAAARAKRDADPDARLRREQDRVHDETANAVMGMWDQGGRQEAPRDVAAIIDQATRNRAVPGVNLEQAIQMAIAARDAQMARQLNEMGNRMMMMNGQVNGMQPMLPSQMRRTW